MAGSEWIIVKDDGDGVPEWAAFEAELTWEDCEHLIVSAGPVSAERVAEVVPSPLGELTLTEFLLARLAEDEATAPRMLAEVKAKHLLFDFAYGAPFRTGDRVMRIIALPYADHPDYRQEWSA